MPQVECVNCGKKFTISQKEYQKLQKEHDGLYECFICEYEDE